MNLLYIAKVLQIIVSILLVAFVLIQGKGGGLSSAVSGSITFYRSKRGIERTVFILTIVLGIVLIVNSLLILYFS